MKRFSSLILALVLALTLCIPMTVHAEGVMYGQVFAIHQPIIVDWSLHATVGKKFRVTLTDLRSKSKQVLKDEYTKQDKISASWAVYYFDRNASYSVTVDVIDENGITIKSITDYFHVGDYVVNPPEEPKDKLMFTGIALNGQAFTSAMWKAWTTVWAKNPAFAKQNCDATPKTWISEFINSKFPVDAMKIMLLTQRVNAFSCNLTMEADLFKKMNTLRATGGKKAFVWSSVLGRVCRLRAFALCDEPLSDPVNSIELGGSISNTLSRYNNHSGSATEWVGYFPSAKATTANILKTLQQDNKFMTALLSEHKYGAITAVQTSKLAGKREKGVAVLAVFSD